MSLPKYWDLRCIRCRYTIPHSVATTAEPHCPRCGDNVWALIERRECTCVLIGPTFLHELTLQIHNPDRPCPFHPARTTNLLPPPSR